MTTTPILWWKGEDNTDESINGANGVVGYAGRLSYVTGVVNKAFHISFTDPDAGNAFYVPSNALFNFEPSSAFTIRFYLKMYSSDTSKSIYVLTKSGNYIAGLTNDIDWGIRVVNGSINFVVYLGSHINTEFASGGTIPYDDQFHDILVTYNNGYWRIYVDSVDMSIDTTAQHLISNHTNFLLEFFVFWSANTALGDIDEIIISIGTIPPAGNKLLENKQLVGFKLETNPFIPEALVAADYGHHAYDIKVEPGIELLPLRAARADFSKEVSISGRRLCAANWKVDLYAMTDPATPPTYFSMLRACGWKQVVHGATGVSIKPDGNYNRVPATIEVAYEDESSEPQQLVYKIGGAMGSVKIIGAAGLPVALEFSFIGTLEGITTRPYASRITPTGFDDETPPALLDEQHSIFMSRRSLIENFEISGNEVVDLFSNIFKCHGYDGARVSGRLLTGKIKIGGIMSLVTNHSGGVVAIGYDATTSERGFLTKMVNRTGHTSVKGEIISCSTTADNEAILQNNEYDAIGIVAEEGVTEGSEMWVWKSGSRAQVLYKDSTAATRGYILLAADTDGRAIDIAVPSSNPVVAQHFKECGHVCESKDAGTNVLVLSDLHFN